MSSSNKHRHRSLGGLETATLLHVGIFLIAITWGFGGNASWIRVPLAWMGSLGLLITLAAVLPSNGRSRVSLRPLAWLWPLGLFNAIVLISLFHPGLRRIPSGPDILLVPESLPAWLPSTALPADSWKALWLFDVIYLSCFNLALTVRRRRALRGILWFAFGNALVLAVFGTVQKLTGATGLFFDSVKSPQTHFFSSFIYHNHWGAFMVLMAACSLGLVWRYARSDSGRGFFNSPGFGGLVGLFFMSLTVPLSTSRSCTILLFILLSGSFLHWTIRLIRHRRRQGVTAAGPLLVALTALVLAIAGTWFLEEDVITARFATTAEQLAQMRQRGGIGSRATLYRDTWRMAQDRLWFGWGMASYPYVFTLYNTQESKVDRLPVFYHDAHNDWLQSAAEHGLIGSVLLGLCGIVPLIGLKRRDFASPLPVYLLVGCGLILIYAWVEFPFGNMAVVLSWWLCFFCAVSYARLQMRDDSGGRPHEMRMERSH